MADWNKFFARTFVKSIFAILLAVTTGYLAFTVSMTAAIAFAACFSLFSMYFLKRYTWMTPPTSQPNELTVSASKAFLKTLAGLVMVATGFVVIVAMVAFVFKPNGGEAWPLALAIIAALIYWRAMVVWDKY